MIRDPSDGSVKEKPVLGIPISKQETSALSAPTSGLPILKRPAELARLERSREWLKQYKGTNADDAG